MLVRILIEITPGQSALRKHIQKVYTKCQPTECTKIVFNHNNERGECIAGMKRYFNKIIKFSLNHQQNLKFQNKLEISTQQQTYTDE